jgi:sugar (pentulose or hexulose) kinase
MKALAMDLGASSGKIFLGQFDGKKITLREVHRFHNEAHLVDGHLIWDFQSIQRNMLNGIQMIASENISSFGVDSFCNDYGLLDKRGNLISNIYSYRDSRTENILPTMDAQFPMMELYRRTGCQRARFNTLVQLIAEDRQLLECADSLLFLSDLLNYTLCGEKKAEYTTASVSQMYSHTIKDWDKDITGAFNIPFGLLPSIIPPASLLGKVTDEICGITGSKPFSIVTVGHHDTASAVVAVPSTEKHFAYISSGTWSLMGTELDEMITSDDANSFNFANEGGVGHKIRFLKNIMGLWLVQECQRDLNSRGIKLTFDELDREAEKSLPFRSIINPDAAEFFEPGQMIEKIQSACRNTKQPIPETPGELVRCIKESLVLAYRRTLAKIESTTGIAIPAVHIIGGGANSMMMNQWTASAIGRPVFAGPFEAAAIGNLCAQFMTAGEIRGLVEARQVIKNSFDILEYIPYGSAGWDDAYERFENLI